MLHAGEDIFRDILQTQAQKTFIKASDDLKEKIY